MTSGLFWTKRWKQYPPHYLATFIVSDTKTALLLFGSICYRRSLIYFVNAVINRYIFCHYPTHRLMAANSLFERDSYHPFRIQYFCDIFPRLFVASQRFHQLHTDPTVCEAPSKVNKPGIICLGIDENIIWFAISPHHSNLMQLIYDLPNLLRPLIPPLTVRCG